MIKSFQNAFFGLCAAVRRERNLRIHLAAAFYVLLAAAVTGVSGVQWCVLLLCIGAVITAELINTAIERLCDYINHEPDTTIGLIKDISAGAVLVSALASAFIGGIIFFNTEMINRTIEFARNFPVFALLIPVTVPAAGYFVFKKYKS